MTPFTKNTPKRKNAQFFKKIFEKWEAFIASLKKNNFVTNLKKKNEENFEKKK